MRFRAAVRSVAPCSLGAGALCQRAGQRRDACHTDGARDIRRGTTPRFSTFFGARTATEHGAVCVLARAPPCSYEYFAICLPVTAGVV